MCNENGILSLFAAGNIEARASGASMVITGRSHCRAEILDSDVYMDMSGNEDYSTLTLGKGNQSIVLTDVGSRIGIKLTAPNVFVESSGFNVTSANNAVLSFSDTGNNGEYHALLRLTGQQGIYYGAIEAGYTGVTIRSNRYGGNYTYTFPSTSGEIALASNATKYVHYVTIRFASHIVYCTITNNIQTAFDLESIYYMIKSGLGSNTIMASGYISTGSTPSYYPVYGINAGSTTGTLTAYYIGPNNTRVTTTIDSTAMVSDKILSI